MSYKVFTGLKLCRQGFKPEMVEAANALPTVPSWLNLKDLIYKLHMLIMTSGLIIETL